MDTVNEKSMEVTFFFRELDELQNSIRQALKNRTPHLNGEKYLSKQDICRMLHISPRTLQDWRDTGKIPFVRVNGKILYKLSEIHKLFEKEDR
jgi:hypothetical protein